MGFGKLGARGGFGSAGVLGSSSITPPAGFNWPFATYPISIRQTGPYSFTTNFVPESYAAAALAGPTYYVNGSTGLNTNSGTSLAAPVKSIWRATQLGNAGAVPFNAQVAQIAGGYGRADGFSNVSTPVPNTVPAAYIATGAAYPAQGGIVDCWVGDQLTWSGTTDPTYTTLYTATRASVSQVINPTLLDAYGDPVMATKYADAATANAASGNAWAQVGSTLYVKWTGNPAVTNTNTRAMISAIPNFVQNATSASVYLKGFNFQGGANGAVAFGAAATMNFIAVNCSAGYAGDASNNVNAWKLDYMTGLCALVNCIATNGEADGFNTHWTPGGTPGIYPLTINCVGRNNGRDTTLSCNGLTWHDNVIALDVMGEYYLSYGSNVIPINACQGWMLGTYAHDSFGDTGHGGTSPPRDFETQNTAGLWLQNCRSAVSATSIIAGGTSTIKTRNFSQGGGQTAGGGTGTITTF